MIRDKYSLTQGATVLFISRHARTHTQCESWITALLRRKRTHLYPPTQLAGILLHITRAHVKTTKRPRAASKRVNVWTCVFAACSTVFTASTTAIRTHLSVRPVLFLCEITFALKLNGRVIFQRILILRIVGCHTKNDAHFLMHISMFSTSQLAPMI